MFALARHSDYNTSKVFDMTGSNSPFSKWGPGTIWEALET